MKPGMGLLLAVLIGTIPVIQIRADVVVLKNGKEMHGIIDEAGSDSNFVKLTTASGSVKVPRDRVKEARKESLAQGWAGIAQDHLTAKKNEQAREAFNKALEADPDFAPAKEGLAQVDALLAKEHSAMRADNIKAIDTLKADIKKATRANEFSKAEELLKNASDLKPTDEQKSELQAMVADLYLAWARERMDKFDRAGAEQKLNFALAASPENDEVIEMLLTLWEGQADKQDQLLQVYETVLKRRPTDAVLRRKLADLYFQASMLEEAAHHYLLIYKDGGGKYRGTPLETQLADTLDRLQGQHAMKKDYDKAIYFYKLLQTIDNTADDSVLAYYEYLKRGNALKADDVPGRLALAEFCEQNGLEQEALQTYRIVLEKEPGNPKALDALARFAETMILQAQEAFNKPDYYAAKTIADQVMRNFPDSEQAQQKAREIAGAAQNEIQRMNQQACDLAIRYVESGDTYYQQAMVFYDRIFNREYSSGGVRISNPKTDARRYFEYASNAYREALRICPSIGNDPTSLVGPRLTEVQGYLTRLSSGPPSRRGSAGQIIDRPSNEIQRTN